MSMHLWKVFSDLKNIDLQSVVESASDIFIFCNCFDIKGLKNGFCVFERDTSSRGGKIKSNKNWHFPLLIGFPLKLSFPSIFPFANFLGNHYCISNRINEHIHIFFCFVAYAIAFRILYRPLFFITAYITY